jgi:trehalose 6-phosphate phosphatase
MRRTTASALARVCATYPCAVVSGRAQADLDERLRGAPLKYLVGDHGIEAGPGAEHHARALERVRPQIEAVAARTAGVDIEHKPFSIAIHYRRARAKRAARLALGDVLANLPGDVRVVAGKLVFNVEPSNAPGKGAAVLGLREREGADTVLYVGDDTADEDVFRLDQPGRLVTARIGAARSSGARYYLPSQRDIEELLRELSALRPTRRRR